MSIEFSEEELEEIKDMAEFSFASSIAGKELTYYENIESLVSNPNTRTLINVENLRDYIEQLKLEKMWFRYGGVEEMPVTDKLILFLEEIIEEKLRS